MNNDALANRLTLGIERLLNNERTVVLASINDRALTAANIREL
jgi:hypothetical protein